MGAHAKHASESANMNHDNPQHCCKNASSVVMELKRTDTGAVPLSSPSQRSRPF